MADALTMLGRLTGRSYTARQPTLRRLKAGALERFQVPAPRAQPDGGARGRDQSDLPMTLDLRIPPRGTEDPHRNAGACVMTVDLYQNSAALRSGL